MQDLTEYKLGETKDSRNIETKRENLHASLVMAQQAYRFLDIFSRELDPFIYDQKDFVLAVKQLAIKNRHSKIRILIAEPARVIQRGHRLVDLALDLSSFIEIKKLSTDNKDFNEGILIVDKIGFVHKNNDARYEAKYNFNDMRTSHTLLNKYDELWETAKPDPNLRRVCI